MCTKKRWSIEELKDIRPPLLLLGSALGGRRIIAPFLCSVTSPKIRFPVPISQWTDLRGILMFIIWHDGRCCGLTSEVSCIFHDFWWRACCLLAIRMTARQATQLICRFFKRKKFPSLIVDDKSAVCYRSLTTPKFKSICHAYFQGCFFSNTSHRLNFLKNPR